jgi:N-acylglucosamine 2-epimerase
MDKSVFEKYQKLISDDLFEKVIPFWENHGFDKAYGGIKTCLDREGRSFSKEKSVWMQGRGGWMFAHLCRRYGNRDQWLEIAKSALNFTKNYCIDPEDGRLYFIVGDDGTPFRKRRYVFSEYFYILASSEYYAVTGDEESLKEARKYYNLVKSIYEDPGADPFKITPKFLDTAPQMRGLANTLMMMAVTRAMRNCDPANSAQYAEAEKALINEILQYHFSEQYGVLLECVGPNGEFIADYSSGRVVNPGHCLETAWYLLQEAEELGDSSIIERVETIYDGAFRYGWDEKYGGLLYFVDVTGCAAPQAYEHDMKLWWVHNEAIISSIKLYRITGKEKYWTNFEKLLDYAFKHFRDEVYGEWYGYLRRDGSPTEPPCKGNIFKGPFHVPRMYTEVLHELNLLLGRTGN